ncbi:DUF4118 domain-containing protein [Ensifer sp. MJa1]|uniref:DUF4118 domain-containing protein n=1 Tax=Ensifer sp. MJa1 TaxID=2919888 RepID=UPI003009CCC3
MASVKSKMFREGPPVLDPDALLVSVPTVPPVAVGCFASIVMTGIATVVAIGVDNGISIPNLSLVFVVPVVIAGVGFGLGPALCSAVLGALAYNFFLTEPRYTLMVDDPANIWAIALLFVIGIIVSGVAHTSRHRASDAAKLRRQILVLKGYGREVVKARDTKSMIEITSKALAVLFEVPAVAMVVTGGKVAFCETTGDIALKDAELDAARSSVATGSHQLAEVYSEVDSRLEFWPVETASGQRAVIGLAFEPDRRPETPETVIDVVRHILALAIEAQQSKGKP